MLMPQEKRLRHGVNSNVIEIKSLMQTIQKAVIPIAGYGTRLFPATKAVLKALFPIIDQDGLAKPIIQLIIEEVLTAGVEEVCLVYQPLNEMSQLIFYS